MRLLLLIATFSVFAFPTSANAQVSNGFLRQIGLETAWKGQMQLPSYGRGVVSTHLWVNSNNSKQYAVVELPQRTLRIASDTPGNDGKPIGLEEAKKRAQDYAARLLGKADGINVQEKIIPEIKLVLVSGDGLVQTMDAETGKVLWSTPCGNASAPAHPAAVSVSGVSVIQGLKLFVLDWETGKQKHTENLKNPSSNALVACGKMAFTADIRGKIDTHGLEVERPRPFGYLMTGRVVGEPASTENGLYAAMATDEGYVYVFAGGNDPTEYIRYESSAGLSGSLASGNNAFYSANKNGIVTKISADFRKGRLLWEYHFGQATTAPALVTGDFVYVASEYGELVAIDDQVGSALWRSPRANLLQPIGKIGNQVLGISNSSELVSIDSETGIVRGRSPAGSLAKLVVNQKSDRIYLITTSGQVQCIRPTGAVLPTMTQATALKPGAADADTSTQEGGSIFNAGDANSGSPFDTPAMDNGNPFGGDAGGGDPFGGDAGGGDPFGGDAGGGDPFGGDGMGDPFGGGSDPFGGSGDPF
ncbi:MAG: PQQ-binding-like beta-propeller repeat protein [Planctomycetota bacterium]